MNRRQFLVGAAALALAPRSLAAPRRPHVLVTADLESHIVVVDAVTGAIVRRIPTRAYPRSIETVGSSAVVCHSELGLVSVLDASSLTVRHVVGGFAEPRYAAAHPDGRHAYVTDAKRGDVALVDTHTGRVLAREPAGTRARHITIAADGTRLWVALGSQAREVAVFQLVGVRLRPARRFAPPALAHDVGFAPDGRHAWVGGGDGRELFVYDLRSGRVVARPAAGLPPQHVTFSDEHAFVTSGWSGSLQVHTLDGEELRSAPIAVGSYNVQQADGIVVTPALGRGYLTTATLAGHVTREQKVARSSHDACIV